MNSNVFVSVKILMMPYFVALDLLIACLYFVFFIKEENFQSVKISNQIKNIDAIVKLFLYAYQHQ